LSAHFLLAPLLELLHLERHFDVLFVALRLGLAEAPALSLVLLDLRQERAPLQVLVLAPPLQQAPTHLLGFLGAEVGLGVLVGTLRLAFLVDLQLEGHQVL